MNGLDNESPMWIQIWQNDNSDLQPGHANSGSSESDLVSSKMKEAVIYTTVVQSR